MACNLATGTPIGSPTWYLGLAPGLQTLPGALLERTVVRVFRVSSSTRGGSIPGTGSNWRWWPRRAAATEGGRHRWVGTLVEPDGTRVYIALFYTSGGGLKGLAGQWLEYYKYNGDKKTPETRGCQSYGKVFFKRPRFQGGGSHNYTGIINLEVFDQCAVAANTPNNRGGFTHKGVYFEGGFLPHPK